MQMCNILYDILKHLPILVYDNMVTEVAMAAALTRSASATGSAIMDGNSVDSSVSNAGGDRVCFWSNLIRSSFPVSGVFTLLYTNTDTETDTETDKMGIEPSRNRS